MKPTDDVQPNFVSPRVDDLNVIPFANGSVVNNRDFQSPNYVEDVSGWKLGSDGKSEFNEVKQGGYKSRFRVSRDTDQTINASSSVKVQFATEHFDGEGEFDNAINFRFVATNAGTYFFHAQASFDTTNLADQSRIEISFKKNGSFYSTTWNQTSGTGIFTIQLTDVLSLSASDYIEVFITNNIASNITAYGGAGQTFFTGYRLY